MTLIAYRDVFRDRLASQFTVGEIDFYFKQIIFSFFGWEATSIGLTPHKSISSEESFKLENAISALIKQEPLQYITGIAPFMQHSFLVNNAVLIPRPETEELVSWILEDFTDLTNSTTVFDIGTGSGCIAISLSLSSSFFKVSAIDVSKQALVVAKKNNDQLNAAVTFYETNILNQNEWGASQMDIIVSNPPYIPPEECADMKLNVLDFEPKLALFVPQDHPLIFYEAIIDFALKNLKTGGHLYFEINPNYKEKLLKLFEEKEQFLVTTRKDIFGKTRMIRAIKK